MPCENRATTKVMRDLVNAKQNLINTCQAANARIAKLEARVKQEVNTNSNLKNTLNHTRRELTSMRNKVTKQEATILNLRSEATEKAATMQQELKVSMDTKRELKNTEQKIIQMHKDYEKQVTEWKLRFYQEAEVARKAKCEQQITQQVLINARQKAKDRFDKILAQIQHEADAAAEAKADLMNKERDLINSRYEVDLLKEQLAEATQKLASASKPVCLLQEDASSKLSTSNPPQPRASERRAKEVATKILLDFDCDSELLDCWGQKIQQAVDPTKELGRLAMMLSQLKLQGYLGLADAHDAMHGPFQ